jgi:hypothetical protein
MAPVSFMFGSSSFFSVDGKFFVSVPLILYLDGRLTIAYNTYIETVNTTAFLLS